jgi:hypothetical protein
MHFYQKVNPTWTGLVLSATCWLAFIVAKLTGAVAWSWWVVNLPAYWPFALIAIFTVALSVFWVLATISDLVEGCFVDALRWLRGSK